MNVKALVRRRPVAAYSVIPYAVSWVDAPFMVAPKLLGGQPTQTMDGMLIRREEHRGRRVRGPFDEWMQTQIVALLSEAIEKGELAPLDTTFTADAMLAAASPRLYIYQRQQSGYSIERIIAGMQALFTNRLRRR